MVDSHPSPQIKQRNRSENLISELTTRFTNLLDTPMEELMRWAVARAGQVFEMDRVSILLYSTSTFGIVKTYEWNNPELDIHVNYPGQSIQSFHWTLEQIQGKNAIQIDRLSQLPPEARTERMFYRQHHFRSLLEFPVHVNQEFVAIVSYIRIQKTKAWTAQELRERKTISELLSIGISRIVAEEELVKTINRYKSLYNHSPIAIWEEDFSQAKIFLKSIAHTDSDELRQYFRQNPEEAFSALSKIQVVDVNDTTIQQWNHPDRSNLVGDLKPTLPYENLESWIEELVAIDEGKLHYLIEDQLIASQSGVILHANLYWNVVPGHEADWDQVLVSAVDITKQFQTEQSLQESEERLRMMLENADDFIFLQDLNGRYLYFNGLPRFELSAADMVGKYPSDFFEPIVAEEIMQALLSVAASKKPVTVEIEMVMGGETNWYSNLLYPIFSKDESVIAIGTISRNITKSKKSERDLAEIQAKLSARVMDLEKRNQEISLLSEMLTMLQFSSELDEAYKIIHQFLQQLFPKFNGSLMEIQNNPVELVSRLSWGRSDEIYSSYQPDDCWAIRSGKKHLVSDPEHSVVCKHIREPYPRNTLCLPIIVDGIVSGCLSFESSSDRALIQESDTRLAQAASEQIGLALTNIRLRIGLRLQAIHDALTGLYNRHYLDETINRELYRQERSGQPLSLIMMDLDHLKQINDIYGHAAGDAVLRELGKLIKKSIRVSDMPCRYGGDEFILVMPDTTLETAQRRAERIALQFKQLSIPYGTQTLGEFSLSIGVASSPEHGHTSQDLFDAADRALYKAKRLGRDRVETAETVTPVEK